MVIENYVTILRGNEKQINFEDPGSYSVISKNPEFGESVISTLKNIFGTSIISLESFQKINIESYDDYLGPVFFDPYYFVFIGQFSSLTIIAINKNYPYNADWILQSVELHLNHNRPISFNSLQEMRYEFLDICTSPIYDDTTDSYNDLFATFPPSNFLNSIIGESKITNNILSDTIDVTNAIEIIEFFLSQIYRSDNNHGHIKNWLEKIHQVFQEHLLPNLTQNPEIMLILLNFYDALILFSPPLISLPMIISFLKKVLSLEEIQKHPSVQYVLTLQKAFLTRDSLPPFEIHKRSIPESYKLIPYFLEVLKKENISQENFNKIQQSISPEIFYRGYFQLMQYIGDELFRQCRYSVAEIYYSELRQKILVKESNFPLKRIIDSKIFFSKQGIFNLYVKTSILHYNIHQFDKAMDFAWSAIRIGLKTIQFAIENSVSPSTLIDSLFNNFLQIKESLLAEEREMNPVIELKLDELYTDLMEIKNLDELLEKINVHQESFAFLMPQTPPKFLFLTPDGRLLYSVTANYDLENSEEETESHLMAGVLTAIRTIFLEASFSGSGNVKEIDAGDTTLYIEARDSVVVVVSSVNLDQELKNFANWIANEIQLNYSEIIDNWDGRMLSLEPIVKFIIQSIKEKLLD